MTEDYVVLGEHIQLRDAGEFLAEHRILMLSEDFEHTVGTWLTPEAFDEKVNDDRYSYIECVIDPIIIRNGGEASIPRGNYTFTFIEEIQG